MVTNKHSYTLTTSDLALMINTIIRAVGSKTWVVRAYSNERATGVSAESYKISPRIMLIL